MTKNVTEHFLQSIESEDREDLKILVSHVRYQRDRLREFEQRSSERALRDLRREFDKVKLENVRLRSLIDADSSFAKDFSKRMSDLCAEMERDLIK